MFCGVWLNFMRLCTSFILFWLHGLGRGLVFAGFSLCCICFQLLVSVGVLTPVWWVAL